MTPQLAFDELFKRATGNVPFPFQKQLATSPEFPDLLRVPTGSGKTAAAVLAWLYRRRFHPDPELRRATPRRLVYCLPMRVLVEQTVQAARGWLARLGLGPEVAVHHLMGGKVEADWAAAPQRDAVLVGTMDMLLSRAMNRGYAASRFRWPLEFGLLNNDCLWVLDEVQLMGNGLATSAQLDAFRQLFGTVRPCPSLWMSATAASQWLATYDRRTPAKELVLTDADLATDLGRRIRATKALRRLDVPSWPRGAASALLGLHRPRTLTLVVANTVDRARALFDEVRRQAPEESEVLLAHSRFRPPDRRDIVSRLTSDPPAAGRIVVATQVVEAGVDVSAATLVTELAPWDSLVQRFGRCNRFGERKDAVVAWVDLSVDKQSAPYEGNELAAARSKLEGLTGGSVSPQALQPLGAGPTSTTAHLLRRADLVDLFDTEPDLAGNHVDVSRFIRDDADVDAHVFWREWDGPMPPRELAKAVPDELCPVPSWEVQRLLERRAGRGRPPVGFAWDHLERGWRAVEPAEVRPGMQVLLRADAGGYAPNRGWDSDVTDPVHSMEPPSSEAEEGVEDDLGEEAGGRWVPLAEHLRRVHDFLQRLLGELDLGAALPGDRREALETAALWHDVGKAHPVFQAALLATVPEKERATRQAALWAKCAAAGRLGYERRHFRHELASALALLAAPRAIVPLPDEARDLAAYLAAAHHGKVRLAIRALPGEKRPPKPGHRYARGIWDGDALGPLSLDGVALPSISLDLSVMEAGRGPDGRPSWTERALRLRDALGPFRLGFLEALLRVADWAASAAEALEGNSHG